MVQKRFGLARFGNGSDGLDGLGNNFRGGRMERRKRGHAYLVGVSKSGYLVVI